MLNTIKEIASQVKEDSFKMASLSEEIRNNALRAIGAALMSHKQEIYEANQLDLDQAILQDQSTPVLKRLKFDEQKLMDVLSGIESLISLPDPLFQKLLERELDTDLKLIQITCPMGVIGVIFESRPDALVQIATLCLKSGNCAILKGGSEAVNTNKALFQIIHQSVISVGIPERFLTLIETRSDISELLKCHESIDLIIPRGSNEFVQYIMENSKIPVMGHADGVCHIYVDEHADLSKAVPIIVDAKTQYVAACNTVETLLVHQSVAETLLPLLKASLEDKKVIIKGCHRTSQIISCDSADEMDFETEYLDYIISIKVVDCLDEAIAHINKYGSHHTDSILTEKTEIAEKFMLLVDSASVYQNCSTRFADGFRYGFGAEVGISTGKLHARGPVGLDGLVTYKYKLYGNGNTVSDYADGKRHFTFKDK